MQNGTPDEGVVPEAPVETPAETPAEATPTEEAPAEAPVEEGTAPEEAVEM